MMNGYRKFTHIAKRMLYVACSILLLISATNAQEVQRPKIWGVAKMTFLVSNFKIARSFYGDFLGYKEVISYQSDLGKVISFKMNDRQFLEFLEDPDAREKNRLVSVSFDCDSIDRMAGYLQSREVKILKEPGLDGAGEKTLVIQGPEFYKVEFIHFLPGGLHKKTTGRFLDESRIANRLHHAGLYVSDIVKANQLFHDILGFTEIWRFKDSDLVKPNYIYLRIPDCVENIEYLVNDKPNSGHPCFRVEDMQQTIYMLKERSAGREIPTPIIGKGNRWLLNMKNEDNTRVEFTESFTVR